jgi:phosphate transport system substrate-binding protein
VRMVNRDGKAVSPDAAAFQDAAAHADWAHSDHYYVILTDQPGAGAWPIAGATFILVPKQPPNVDNAAAALKFFDWAYAHGGKMAEDLDYVPLPAAVVDQIKATWAAQIKAPDGKPVYTAAK